MKYLINITNTYNTHNSLEREVQEFLKVINRTLIKSEDIDLAKSAIVNEIDRLSHENKRCKPIGTNWYKSGSEDQDWSMFLTGICGFTLLHVSGKNPFCIPSDGQDETA
jgi:hypothetical protein